MNEEDLERLQADEEEENEQRMQGVVHSNRGFMGAPVMEMQSMQVQSPLRDTTNVTPNRKRMQTRKTAKENILVKQSMAADRRNMTPSDATAGRNPLLNEEE